MSSFNRDIKPILLLFLREKKFSIIIGTLMATATVISGIALLGLSGWFITATALAGASVAAAMTFNIFTPSAGIRFFAITRTGGRYAERLITHEATLGVLAALRERLFRGWALPGAARLLLRHPGKLLFRLTADIDALDSLYLRVVVPAAVSILTAIGIGVVLGLMEPVLGIVVGAGLLVTGLGIPYLAARQALVPGMRRASTSERLRSRAIDLVSGQTELVMTGRLHAQAQAVLDADQHQSLADDRLNAIETRVGIGFGVISAVLLSGVLCAVAALSHQGTITAPVATLGVLIAFGALEPFTGLRRGALELGRTILAARRLASRLVPDPVATARGTFTQPADADIALDLSDVAVRPEGADHIVIDGITLSVKRGERIAIVGTSGAGKSTLLSAIGGEIPVAHGTLERLPATLLTQRTELFQDSLRDNLRLAKPDADDAELIDALEAAGLSLKDTATLPDGLDTRLGEGGMGLSGGQGRRLALARLLLRDTPLWLLDEPTEGLDASTANDVIKRLDDGARAHNRTLVITTHIQREAAIADRMLILDHGKIVATPKRGEKSFNAALDAMRPG